MPIFTTCLILQQHWNQLSIMLLQKICFKRIAGKDTNVNILHQQLLAVEHGSMSMLYFLKGFRSLQRAPLRVILSLVILYNSF